MDHLTLIENLENTSSAPWVPHPKYPGVTLKTLVNVDMTGGSLSQLLVHVDPGCALETHTHPTQCELHLVMHGNGKAWLEDAAIDYRPGSLNAIPAGSAHAVQAGSEGLTLLASFGPSQA